MPCTSGVLAICSMEIFDHYTIVLPRSQISLVVSDSPGRMADFIAPDGGRSTAACKAGSTWLNAWQFFLFPLVLLSAEHWALGMRYAFPKDSSDVMTNTTQKDRGVNLWRDSWPMRNRRWERADSLVHSHLIPNYFSVRTDVPCGLPGHVPNHTFLWSCASPCCFCFLTSLSHLLVSLIHSCSHWLHSFPKWS